MAKYYIETLKKIAPGLIFYTIILIVARVYGFNLTYFLLFIISMNIITGLYNKKPLKQIIRSCIRAVVFMLIFFTVIGYLGKYGWIGFWLIIGYYLIHRMFFAEYTFFDGMKDIEKQMFDGKTIKEYKEEGKKPKFKIPK